jgi:hypothetical protein
MNEYYDRYGEFKIDGNFKPLPFIKISPKSTDKIIPYLKNRDRMDKLSQSYYNSPYYGWLIMAANPQLGGLEFDIPNNELIRIPFPLKVSIQQYIEGVNNYNRLIGI